MDRKSSNTYSFLLFSLCDKIRSIHLGQNREFIHLEVYVIYRQCPRGCACEVGGDQAVSDPGFLRRAILERTACKHPDYKPFQWDYVSHVSKNNTLVCNATELHLENLRLNFNDFWFGCGLHCSELAIETRISVWPPNHLAVTFFAQPPEVAGGIRDQRLRHVRTLLTLPTWFMKYWLSWFTAIKNCKRMFWEQSLGIEGMHFRLHHWEGAL